MLELSLNKKFYSRRQDLETQGENFFSKASKNISTIAPIIFGIILGPTVVVSSIMSQAAFLMIANILLSIGLSLAFFNKIYQGNAKFPEVFLTLGIITALFFLVLYLSPVITGWDLLGVISFINLFASSINSFFLLRTVVLPPFLALIQYVLSKIGINVDIHLDKHRDFQVEIDLEKGCKSDSAATELLTKNYPWATIENFSDNNWRKQAIIPYNNSKEMIYGYATKYRSMPFGEINNHEKISKCLKLVDNIMFDAATDSSHNVLLRNKLIRKSQKIKFMSDDLEILKNASESSSKKDIDNFIKNRFIHVKHNVTDDDKKPFVDCLENNITMQLNKIIKLLQCYPLHLAIDSLDKYLNQYLSPIQKEKIREAIATENIKELYTQKDLQRLGLFQHDTCINVEINNLTANFQNLKSTLSI